LDALLWLWKEVARDNCEWAARGKGFGGEKVGGERGWDRGRDRGRSGFRAKGVEAATTTTRSLCSVLFIHWIG